MRSALLLIGICSCFCQQLTAQKTHLTRKGSLQVGIGYQRTWMSDRQASPLKYQSSEKTFSLAYRRSDASQLFDISLKGAFGPFFPTGFSNRKWYHTSQDENGTIRTDSNTLRGTIYNTHLKIGYARSVDNGMTRFGNKDLISNRYAGASISSQLFYSDNIVRTGWMHAATVNADFTQLSTLGNKHHFRVGISIPLFARNTRLPYHNTVNSPTDKSNLGTVLKQGSRWTWFGNFQNIRIDAQYTYNIASRTQLGLHYSGQWLHYRYENPITLFQNNIGLTLGFQ